MPYNWTNDWTAEVKINETVFGEEVKLKSISAEASVPAGDQATAIGAFLWLTGKVSETQRPGSGDAVIANRLSRDLEQKMKWSAT